MNYTLQNAHLKAIFSQAGAEVIELTDKKGTNYIWTADANYWSRHAPILFPFVGKVNQGTYTYDEQTYTIGQHGFARDCDFSVVKSSLESITFRLVSDEHTHALYPFNFILDVVYTLKENTLEVCYQVYNTNTCQMAFKIGAHPGFNCPLFEGETLEDYMLTFNHTEDTQIHYLTKEGLLSHETDAFKGSTLALSKDTFAKDALIFKDLESSSITLSNKAHTASITVDFEGFPCLGIWSPSTGAPFVCIEPWYGHADAEDESLSLMQKENLVTAEPSAGFYCSYRITLG